MTYTVTISEIDYNIILIVKSIREKRGLSQRDLSALMGLNESFVGKVESLSQPDKYSIRHLNLLAKALNLKSFSQLLPKEFPENDMIEITFEKVVRLKKDGSPSKLFDEKVVKINPVRG